MHAFTTDYADCGSLQVYAGVDPDDAGEALGAILIELSKLRDEPVPAAELEKTRNYVRGRLELRLEESRHLASWIGVQEALHDRVLTLDEAIENLDAVTAEQIQAPGRPTVRGRGADLGRRHATAPRCQPRPRPPPAMNSRWPAMNSRWAAMTTAGAATKPAWPPTADLP